MKLKLFSKNKKPTTKKHERFNPHRYWRFLLAVFAVVFVGVFLYFTWFFYNVSDLFSQPISAETSENSEKILKIKQDIELIEKSIQKRSVNQPRNFSDPSI